MERIGIRELRQRASEIIRRVAAGETFEVSDRGRAVATLTRIQRSGLAELERRGLVRRGKGRLEDMRPLPAKKGLPPLSQLVEEGREERISTSTPRRS
jgi:prevent-host-death family protein